MPKGPVETPITDQEMAFAHLILAGKLTDREAADAVGISPGQAAYVKAKPRVKEYMASHRASVAAAMVEHESAVLVEFNIGREQIMARYYELGMLPPTETNGNITGQVKALDSLREMLGLVPGKEQETLAEPQPNIYRAAWMRKPEEQDTDEEEELRPEPPSPIQAPDPMPSVQPVRVEVPTQTAREPRVVMGNALGAGELTRVRGGNFGRFQSF